MIDLARLPPGDVLAMWVMLRIRTDDQPFTLQRFGDPNPGVPLGVASREDASARVPENALPVPRALGDDPRIVAAWIEVSDDLRTLLLSDEHIAGATVVQTPRPLGPPDS